MDGFSGAGAKGFVYAKLTTPFTQLSALKEAAFRRIQIWRNMLPSSVDLYNLADDPSEQTNRAAIHPDKVLEMQRRIDALAKEASKPLFLVDQFKVVMKNMNGEPVLPTDERFGDPEYP